VLRLDEELHERIRKLISELGSYNYHKAMDELANIGKPAISALIEAMKNKDKRVSAKAADSICRIQDVFAIPGLISLFSYGKEIRHKAHCVLLSLGASAVPEIVRALKNDNGEVRRSAIGTISRFYLKSIKEKKVKEMDLKVKQGLMKLSDRYKKQDLHEVKIQIAELRIMIADLQNELSKDKGILLDDKPKPPKKGRIYQQSRQGIIRGRMLNA
jgi:HEAT repeat protein